MCVCVCELLCLSPPADLGRPSKEQLALQAELQRVESTRRLDREECESQRQVLQAQLQSEVSHATG